VQLPPSENQAAKKKELESLTVKDLKEMAKEKSISGYSRLRKSELIAKILEAEFGSTPANATNSLSQKLLNSKGFTVAASIASIVGLCIAIWQLFLPDFFTNSSQENLIFARDSTPKVEPTPLFSIREEIELIKYDLDTAFSDFRSYRDEEYHDYSAELQYGVGFFKEYYLSDSLWVAASITGMYDTIPVLSISEIEKLPQLEAIDTWKLESDSIIYVSWKPRGEKASPIFEVILKNRTDEQMLLRQFLLSIIVASPDLGDIGEGFGVYRSPLLGSSFIQEIDLDAPVDIYDRWEDAYYQKKRSVSKIDTERGITMVSHPKGNAPFVTKALQPAADLILEPKSLGKFMIRFIHQGANSQFGKYQVRYRFQIAAIFDNGDTLYMPRTELYF
jgi:hypothetical protein